jgi:guanylate kinase
MILNKKRIILCGRAASGKDYLRKLLQEDGFKYQISYTTRPPRAMKYMALIISFYLRRFLKI